MQLCNNMLLTAMIVRAHWVPIVVACGGTAYGQNKHSASHVSCARPSQLRGGAVRVKFDQGGLQRGDVTVAAKVVDIAPDLTGNTPILLRPIVVSAAAPLLVLIACKVMHQIPGSECSGAS